MPSYDVTAFYLLGEKVSEHVKVVLAGQGADEVFGGYFWYPRMDAASGSPLQRFSQHYFDRDHDEFLAMVAPKYRVADVTSEWVTDELEKPKADEFLDEVFRLDVTALMVDDPVKRVDNMTMAWGLERACRSSITNWWNWPRTCRRRSNSRKAASFRSRPLRAA